MVAVLALAVSVIIPAAGIAGERQHARVPNDLLAAAQANSDATFNVIVQGDKSHQSDDIAKDVKENNGQLKRMFRSVSGVSATLTGKQIVKLATNSHIRTITRDARMRTSAVDAGLWRELVGSNTLLSKPAVTCATDALGIKLVSTCVDSPAVTAPQAPAIAIVDSGIDSSRVDDFGSRVVARVNFSSLEPDASGDPAGHGTMVAGVAAGAGSLYGGVAQNAPLVDVRVASSHGEALTGDIIAAVDWILANKDAYNIRVVNMSLGGSAQTSFRWDPLDKAVEKLWLSGVVVTVSGGNQGADGPVSIGSPANDPFVITVGSVGLNGTLDRSDDSRAPWSAYGYTADGFAKPDVSAPGRSMVMPVPTGALMPSQAPDRVVAPGYMWMSGTSFSAPVAAGGAAQILARHPGFTPDQVKGALMASAQHLSSAGTGIGELDLAAAAAIDNPPNPNEGFYAFVSNGTFDADAWAAYVRTNSNWTESNWVESNWVESNWVESNWVESNWTESNWVESNWVESNWVESNWIE